MSEETKDVVKKEEQEVDDMLFNEACEKIITTVSNHAEEAIKEVGKYLIKAFFKEGDDKEVDYEKARKKDKIINSSKGATLNQVFNHFTRDASEGKKPDGPSKSWLYQAIDFVIQEKDLEKSLSKKSFQTYGKLLLSHKVELLRLEDDAILKKEKLILKVDKEKLTVRQLREEINRTMGSGRRTPGILTFINKPELLLEATDEINVDSLKEEQLKNLEKFSERIKDRQEKLQKELSDFEQKIEDYKQYLDKIDELKNNVGKAIELKKDDKKTKSKK